MLTRILLVVDGTAPAEQIVPRIRQHLTTGGEIRLLIVLPSVHAAIGDGEVSVFANRVDRSGRLNALAYLETVAEPLRADGVRVVTEVRVGEAVGQIVEAAIECDAQTIGVCPGPVPFTRRRTFTTMSRIGNRL